MNAQTHTPYWHCGGLILTKYAFGERRVTSYIDRELAEKLFGFFSRQALEAEADGDLPVARYCARTAIDLHKAMAGQDRHLVASGPAKPVAQVIRPAFGHRGAA